MGSDLPAPHDVAHTGRPTNSPTRATNLAAALVAEGGVSDDPAAGQRARNSAALCSKSLISPGLIPLGRRAQCQWRRAQCQWRRA